MNCWMSRICMASRGFMPAKAGALAMSSIPFILAFGSPVAKRNTSGMATRISGRSVVISMTYLFLKISSHSLMTITFTFLKSIVLPSMLSSRPTVANQAEVHVFQ